MSLWYCLLLTHSSKFCGKSHPLSHHQTVAVFLREDLPQTSCVYCHINFCSSNAGRLSYSCFSPDHFRIPTVLHASCGISNDFLQTAHPQKQQHIPSAGNCHRLSSFFCLLYGKFPFSPCRSDSQQPRMRTKCTIADVGKLRSKLLLVEPGMTS